MIEKIFYIPLMFMFILEKLIREKVLKPTFKSIILKINRIQKSIDFIIRNYILKKYLLSNYFSYKFSFDILEYIHNNNININKFMEDLDSMSRDIVNEIISNIYKILIYKIIIKKKHKNKVIIKRNETIKYFMNSIQKEVKLPLNYYETSVFFYECGLKLLKNSIIKKIENKDFIDGGAFIGDSAYVFEKRYNPNKIYAFEPDKKNYYLLLKTIKLNNLNKVIPINKGLHNIKKRLNLKSMNSGSFICKQGDQNIQLIKIDDFVFENNIDVGLIKLDIEGFELNAIKGAIKTIKKFKPVLLISIYHNGEEFFEAIKFLKKINPNYKIKIRKLDFMEPLIETVIICWNQE
ncbi:MAG: FkbM family methyltransferase [Promethearchaeota archaeon]